MCLSVSVFRCPKNAAVLQCQMLQMLQCDRVRACVFVCVCAMSRGREIISLLCQSASRVRS